MIKIEELKNKIIAFDKSFDHPTNKVLIKRQCEKNAAHPHNESIYRFITSEYYNTDMYIYYNNLFKENAKNEQDFLKLRDRILIENKQNIKNQDKILKNKGVKNLNVTDFLPYIKFFNIQLSVETTNMIDDIPVMYCRHTCGDHNYLINNIDIIDFSFNTMKKLDECNKKQNWNDILKLQEWKYNQHIISLSWRLYEIGLGEYVIDLLTPFYNTIKIFTKNIKLDDNNIINKFFEYPIFGPRPYYRIKSSIAWALAMSYLQIGNIEKYLEILKDLITYYPYKNEICYRLNSRHLEAAIRIYTIEKNNKNLEKMYSIFDDALNKTPEEHSESLMERCLVMYEFFNKIKIKNL